VKASEWKHNVVYRTDDAPNTSDSTASNGRHISE